MASPTSDTDVFIQVGAASVAKDLVPDLRWAAYGGGTEFDVKGRQKNGKPKNSLLRKGVNAAVGTALFMSTADDAVDSDGRSGPPKLVVFGRQADCLSCRHVECLITETLDNQIWVLAPRGLILVAWRPDEGEHSPPKGSSLLGKALWVGKAVAEAGVDTVKILSGREIEQRDKWAHGRFEVKAEVPIADIAGIGREVRDRRSCVRVSLRDGSGFDFFFAPEQPQVHDWMIALARSGA
ncbi:hypothetical protein AB5J62_01700 [Amycolatopsis sp. cg5]|uniref:hypothetical protein n=1 Tax=Amycolatopsis sp. cg5 TaxID=3238802 RepID=UPI003524DECE